MLDGSKMSGRNILIYPFDWDLSNERVGRREGGRERGTKCARFSSARRSREVDAEFILTAHGRVECPAPVALC